MVKYSTIQRNNMDHPLPIDVVFNAVPDDYALLARREFLSADYDKIVQERKTHFSRDFPDPSPFIPSHDEVYYSEFYRSNFLEGNPIIKECYSTYIKPTVERYSGKKVKEADLRCYKMIEGGHFRVHRDSYKASLGFVWYLSKEWKWDWGGLLLTINDNQTADITIPKFNQLVIMDHGYNRVPHCVTPVTKYAREPRIMLVGFLETEN